MSITKERNQVVNYEGYAPKSADPHTRALSYMLRELRRQEDHLNFESVKEIVKWLDTWEPDELSHRIEDLYDCHVTNSTATGVFAKRGWQQMVGDELISDMNYSGVDFSKAIMYRCSNISDDEIQAGRSLPRENGEPSMPIDPQMMNLKRKRAGLSEVPTNSVNPELN